MANKKYKLSDDYWEASGIYDIGQSKTQRVINNDLITGKANKSETVSTITYDSTNHKLKKTINGTTTDVMTVDTTPTNNSMNPISSDAAYDLKGAINTVDGKFPVSVANGGTGGTTQATAVAGLGIGKLSSSGQTYIAPSTSHELKMSTGVGLLIITITGSDNMWIYGLYTYGSPATHRWKAIATSTVSGVTITTSYNKITINNQSSNDMSAIWLNAANINASITDTLLS